MPKRAVESEARRRSLNMKTTEALRAKLEVAAARSGRVLSHEVETRLEKSIERDEAAGGEHTSALLDYIGACIRLVEASHGGMRWDASADMAASCRSAVGKALTAVLLPNDDHSGVWDDAAVHLLMTEYIGRNTLNMNGLHEIDSLLVEKHTVMKSYKSKSAALSKAGDRAKLRIDRIVAGLVKAFEEEAGEKDDRMTYARWMEITA